MMIWQWMDGLVSRKAITRELEAYKEAGISGVQNFMIGGPLQTLIKDTTNSIGSDNWKSLFKFTLKSVTGLGSLSARTIVGGGRRAPTRR